MIGAHTPHQWCSSTETGTAPSPDPMVRVDVEMRSDETSIHPYQGFEFFHAEPRECSPASQTKTRSMMEAAMAKAV
jgi:hypothetical protein